MVTHVTVKLRMLLFFHGFGCVWFELLTFRTGDLSLRFCRSVEVGANETKFSVALDACASHPRSTLPPLSCSPRLVASHTILWLALSIQFWSTGGGRVPRLSGWPSSRGPVFTVHRGSREGCLAALPGGDQNVRADQRLAGARADAARKSRFHGERRGIS